MRGSSIPFTSAGGEVKSSFSVAPIPDMPAPPVTNRAPPGSNARSAAVMVTPLLSCSTPAPRPATSVPGRDTAVPDAEGL